MNPALDRLAAEIGLAAPENEPLRLRFARDVVERVEHLLEEPDVLRCLAGLDAYLEGRLGPEALAALAERARTLATGHPGSRSIDGCGHAAVSASYAVAHAIAGKALVAADYAAYAAVYGSGGYGAVSDPTAFEPERQWQARRLAALAASFKRAAPAPSLPSAGAPNGS